MSYILKALKKAENDRAKDDPSRIEDILSADLVSHSQKKEKYFYKFLIIFVFIMLSITVFYFISEQHEITNNSSITSPSKEGLSDAAGQNLSEDNRVLTIEDVILDEVLILENSDYKLPDFNLSGYIFLSEGSAANRLFIDDRAYSEGESINSGWEIKSITRDGFIIKKDDVEEKFSFR